MVSRKLYIFLEKKYHAKLLIRYQRVAHAYLGSVSERHFMISFTLYAAPVIGFSNPIAEPISGDSVVIDRDCGKLATHFAKIYRTIEQL